jgi:quinone-modifying oxidoreductase subunit QmoC
MEDRYLIQSDTGFISELIDSGGASLKKCFQCGTCSVVCSLSPSEKPFPRKEMIWAQWGLKDRLLKDPDVWLCHQCTDCSAHCPRGAKPGDVLAAIRSYTIGYFSRPRFLAKALSAPKYLPVVLIIPALIVFFFFWAATGLKFYVGIISPEDLIPDAYLYIFLGVLFAFIFIVFGSGTSRFWKSISEFEANSGNNTGSGGGWVKIWLAVLIDILKHSRFGKCDKNKISRYTHLAIFYGFILLVIATATSAALHHLWSIYSPHPLIGPVKIAGNFGALLLLVSLIIVIYRRYSDSAGIGGTSYFDWFLVWILLLAVVSGIATEVIRLAGLRATTYWVYLGHLWLVVVFLLYLPFFKGAHIVYRTVALAYARQIGRLKG